VGRAKRPSGTIETTGWESVEEKICWKETPLLVPVGLPGPGKSTWAKWQAKRQGYRVISADAIRLELFSSLREANSNPRNNAKIFHLLRLRLREALGGQGVIVDATNLYPHAREPLYSASKAAGRNHEIIFFSR